MVKEVEWAIYVLPNFGKEAPKSPKPTEVKKRPPPKRERSQDVPSDPSAKRQRVQPGRSFAEIAKKRILLGVVDKNDPSDRIPRKKWKWVEAALATKCFEILAKEPGPLLSAKTVGGVKVIACDDERSAELYKAAVKEPGEVIWIPASIKAPDQILTMLQRCNPNLFTSDWRVVKVDEMEGPTNQAILTLNKEFLAPIEAAHGELDFGFSSVTIKVYKSDSAKEDRGDCLRVRGIGNRTRLLDRCLAALRTWV
ncbi:uncharacterized protein LOC122756601 [Drosophila santomea]|uniref:uncharacterized protein LOC122756601 n=1 Tax=Drosophila santomea TaxID=129105 RepID=UPI001CCF51D2|nr:uncharacterized protein LOC122756601 [Drosophila santomea]